MLKITSLGHGGAFAGINKGNTSFLIEIDDKKLLFDCGTLTPYILRDEMGINFHEIDAVYISHSHADHVGGLPLFLQSRYWIPKMEDGKRVLPTIHAHKKVWDEIYDSLTIEIQHKDPVDGRNRFLENFANVTWSPDISSVAKFNYVKQNHIPYNGVEGQKPVYGLKFEYKGKRVLLTADTAEVADLAEYDYVFHDCEAGNYRSGVHAHFDDILAAFFAIPLDKRPNLYLTHYTTAREGEELNNLRWFEKGSKLIID